MKTVSCSKTAMHSAVEMIHLQNKQKSLRSADFNLLFSWGYFCVGDEGGPKLLRMTVYSQTLSKFQNQQEDGFHCMPLSFFTSQKVFWEQL